MRKLKICAIGGGSSYTPELIEGLINRYSELPVGEIWLTDIEEGREKLEIIGALSKRMVARAGLPISIHTTLDRCEGIYGADFITTQIRVGQLEARKKDERIPLSHGVLGQETNGAGGLFNALRTIPVMLDISKDIASLSPEAWLINFANPSGMVTEALIRHGAVSRVVGLCNVPLHIEKTVAKLLEVESERVSIMFGGLNHMVFGLRAALDGEDVMERVLGLISDKDNAESMTMKNIAPVCYEPRFLRALGVIPCSYHSYYYKKDFMLRHELEAFSDGKTRAEKVMEIEKELFELYKRPSLDLKPPQLEKRGGAYYSDAACRLISSIYRDARDVQTVDTRNNGTIAGIDADSAIEASCVITRGGPVPLNIGKLPVAVNGFVMQLKSFERLAVEAAVEGSVEKAILALAVNPLIPSDEMAKTLVLEMLEAHKAYLPQFFMN